MILLISNKNALGAILIGCVMLALSALIPARKKQRQSRVTRFFLDPIHSFKNRCYAWLFLLKGPGIIQDGYNKANGAPFEVLVPENRYLFVSSAEHIREVDAAPDTVLSLQAAAKSMLQPKYTMHNFNWFDKRGTEGMPLVRTLRTLLTNNIPEILPEIRMAISELFDTLHDAHPVVDGVKHSPLYAMVIEAVAFSNSLAFFGKELAHNQEFMKAAIDFIENTLLIAEIVRLVPAFIAPTIGNLLARKYNSHQAVHNALVPVTQQRLEEKERQKLGHQVPEHKDCIQWVMETSPKQKPWSAERIVHELMALWFGSVHVLTTTICFAMHDLCLHPEYIAPIRAELESSEWAEFERTGRGLPFLDSFIKESARTTPVESISTRRQALQPFTLSNGSKIETGEWVCTPARAMMRDPANYGSPLEFHGFRFLHPEQLKKLGCEVFKIPEPRKPSQLTEVADWQIWGTGRMACPGRFYAAAVMKTTLGLFITKYDFKLSRPESSRWFIWRSFIYPRPSTTVILDQRSAI